MKNTLETLIFFTANKGLPLPFPKGLKLSISSTRLSSKYLISNGESIFITGIISSSERVHLELRAFLKRDIFSSFTDRPAAIGCPPNFSIYSLHLFNSSNILYPSILRADPFGISFPFVITIAGKLNLSLTLPATIPAILSCIPSSYTSITFSPFAISSSTLEITLSTLSKVNSCLSTFKS